MSSPDTEMTVTNPDVALRLLWALNAKRLIGQRISRRMEELGIESDEEMARLAGVTTKTVWRLRNGKSEARTDTAKKMATALGLPLEDLRPPKSPEEDEDLREQLHEVLSRLQRIESALGVPEEEPEPSGGNSGPVPQRDLPPL